MLASLQIIRRQLLTLIFLATGAAQAQAQSNGVFPPEPFNGLQIAYQVAGAQVTKNTDVPGFTWKRSLTIAGFDGSGKLSVSGKLTADWGYGAEVVVGVMAAGKNESKVYKIEPGKPQAFNVALAVPKGASMGSVSIVMTGNFNAGSRGVVISGSWDARDSSSAPVAVPAPTRAAPVAKPTPTEPSPAYANAVKLNAQYRQNQAQINALRQNIANNEAARAAWRREIDEAGPSPGKLMLLPQYTESFAAANRAIDRDRATIALLDRRQTVIERSWSNSGYSRYYGDLRETANRTIYDPKTRKNVNLMDFRVHYFRNP